MNAGAIVAGKQNRYMRRFEDAGATSPASARTPEELGCRQSFVFKRLVKQGVFVEAPGHRYYIDLVTAAAFRARRRAVVLAIVGIALLVVIFLLLTR